MSRWKPDARGRLEHAAYELFVARGYEVTTVAEIAARAGLTERTFFRHYADKREVFFGGTDVLTTELARTFETLPPEVAPLAAVRAAVRAISRLLNGRRPLARERQRILDAHADLRERSLIKRATLTEAIARALRQRGLDAYAAGIAADMGIAVFYNGFDEWLEEPGDRELIDVVDEGFERLRAFASAM